VTPRHPDTDRPLREALRDLVIFAGTTENPPDALAAADRLADTLGLRLPAEPEAPDIDLWTLAEAIRLWYAEVGRNPVTGNYDQPRAAWLIRKYGELRASQPVPTPEPPAEPWWHPATDEDPMTCGRCDQSIPNGAPATYVLVHAAKCPASVPVAAPGLREAAQAVIDAMDYTKGSAAYLAALKALRAALAER
jgi:hypothetical protein